MPDKEIAKREAERRRKLPDRPQPQRPEGFGQTAPTESDGNTPPQRSRPDVFLDAHAHVGRIEFTLDGLEAHVRLHAQVLDLLQLSVGADAALDHIGLVIDDIQVDALVEVRLDAIESIVVRLIEAIDNNPEIIRDLTRGVGKAVENVGEGAEEALEEVGEGVSDIGEGVGSGADKALGGVGEGVKGIGEGTGKGVEGLGKGAGEGVAELGKGAGEGVGGAGKRVGQEAEGLADQGQSQKTADKEAERSGNNRQGERDGGRSRQNGEGQRRQRSGNGAGRRFESHGGYVRR